jgi:hypothetical protein
MSDFIVRFHGLKLGEEHLERVQSAIQKAVMTEVSAASLASYTPDPDGPDNSGGTVIVLPNHIWRGIIVLPSASLRNSLEAVNATYSVVAE